MKHLILIPALGFILTGCGDTSRVVSQPTQPKEVHNTTVYSNGGDVTINDTEVSGSGTYIQNADGTVTYTTGNDNSIGRSGDDSHDGEDSRTGNYDESWDQAECTDNGYFWCTLENKCLNKPANGSSCTSKTALSIGITIL